MSLFQKRKTLPVPEECREWEIAVEKSICTGEMTVGFRDPATGKLRYAELARSDEEVQVFKEKYGR